MYPLLSRLFVLLLSPLSWTLLLALAALVLRGRRPGSSLALALCAALVLTAFSLDAVADRLCRSLERDAPRSYQPSPPYDVVVILGGAIDSASARATGELELNEAGDRLTRGFEVWRAGAARNVLVSGGIVSPEPGEVPEADLFAAALVRWGVPKDQVFSEPSSRNTRENAVESAKVVAARRWKRVLLVTSAAHMQRALGCFRKAGLVPDTLPVDYRGGDGRGAEWLPRAGSLSKSTDALRELSGRLVYRVLGYVDP